MENQIQQYLSNAHHITVSMEWLSACIEWLQQDQLTPAKDLPSSVYQQWRLADLHELQWGCLPNDLGRMTEGTISGYFALQIDSLLDISKPLYQQFVNLKGKDHSNAVVTADTDQKEKYSAHRLLQLKLTDGVQDVVGIEYQPIPLLNENLPPGTKVLIHGKVLCHSGTLLLTKDNVKVLGGEVSELAMTNSLAAIIESKLNIKRQNEGIPALPSQNLNQNVDDFDAMADEFYRENPEMFEDFPDEVFNKPQVQRSHSTPIPARPTTNTQRSNTCSAATGLSNDDLDWVDDDEFLSIDLPPVRPLTENTSMNIMTNPSQSRSPTDGMSNDDSDLEFEVLLRSATVISRSRPSPFVYLSSLPTLPTGEHIRARIKGFVISFLGGLRTNKGRSWSFNAMINDGTRVIPVQFANDVLERLIGMKVPAFKRLQSQSKTDENARVEVGEVLQRIKRRLLDLCCLFDIDIEPHSTVVNVTDVKEVENEVLQYLQTFN